MANADPDTGSGHKDRSSRPRDTLAEDQACQRPAAGLRHGRPLGGMVRTEQDAAAHDDRDRSQHASAEASDDDLRLPHEHDQSSDQQTTQSHQARKLGNQAYKDKARGRVDTDEGYVADGVKPPHEKRGT